MNTINTIVVIVVIEMLSLQELEQRREEKGLQIVNNGKNHISRVSENNYVVKSQSGNGSYLVSIVEGEWRCECPDHTYRFVECKHIHAVKFWIALRERILLEMEEKVSEIICPLCGSSEVKKNGSRKTKVGKRQRFACLNCNKSFMVDEPFKKIIGDPKIVSACLDLYFKGISLRKIVDHVKQFSGLTISHVTVHNWLKRYMGLINAYVNKLDPQLGTVWHVDEMKVKNGGQWSWLWNVMDEKTRFMLVSTISKTRDIQDARRVFQKAKETAKSKPEYVVSDGLPAYIKAFKKEFFTLKNPRVQHIRKPRFTDPTNNNIVERLNGTVREREKVMRGMKSDPTAEEIVNGFKTYYNFIRPHQSLNGKTPAEASGIDLNLEKNKWLSLIRNASGSK